MQDAVQQTCAPAVLAFEDAAAALISDPADPDILKLAVESFCEALTNPDALAGMDQKVKRDCYRVLLLQEDCPTRPLVLAREAARHLTSNNQGLVKTMISELVPVLRQLLEETPKNERRFVNVLVFALTTRAFLGRSIDQSWLSDLHVANFSRFGPSDLSLPYSVMFQPQSFWKNRDDLLDAHLRCVTVNLDQLDLHHVLLLEWLANRNIFPARDNSDLAVCLKRLLDLEGPQRSDQSAVGRMLLMRHWKPDGVLSPERLKALGLADITELARRAAEIRGGLPNDPSKRLGARMLHSKLYQGLQVGRQKVLAASPILHLRKRKIRVAVCVSGQLRGYQAALTSWKRTLLPDVEATFFVHSWTKIGNADATPFRYILPFEGQHFAEAYRKAALAEGYNSIRARYPSLFAKLDTSNLVTADRLSDEYKTDHVVLENDQAPEFQNFSNQQKMHYKIFAADRMARDLDNFDLFMRIRPDLSIKLRGFDWWDLCDACSAKPVVFAEKPYGVHYGGLMIGDQCAVASRDAMKIYADTWVNFPKYAAAELAACPTSFSGHVSLALSCWIGGVDVQKLPVRFAKLEEPRRLSIQDTLDALRADSRRDDMDEQLIQAALRDS